MNQTKTLLESAQNLVNEGELAQAIDLVWERLSPKSSFKNDFANLNGRWKDVKREKLGGNISYEVYLQHRNQISRDLLDFVSLISEEDLDLVRDPDKIAAHLFVLTPTDDTEAAMSRFFPFEYFREVEFDSEKDYQTLDPKSPNTLVIIDFFNHNEIEVSAEKRKEQLEKLQWLLDNREYPFVWFGDRHEMVSQHLNRIGAANFPFTLYARIREMLDYLKYYQGKTT